MSIHEIAKQIGVSEYALKKYGKENGVFRAGDSRRYKYEFSESDLKKIKKNYKRYKYQKKEKDYHFWLFYKCIFQPGNVRYSTPVGRFFIKNRKTVDRFIKSQFYVSSFGKKSNHFEVVNYHTGLLRIKKILNKELDEEILECVIKVLPLDILKIQDAVSNGLFFTEEMLFGEKLKPEGDFIEVSLDDLSERSILETN